MPYRSTDSFVTLILPDQVRVPNPVDSDLSVHITALLPRQSVSLEIDDRNFMKIGKFYFNQYYIGVTENGIARIKAANFQTAESAIAVARLFATKNSSWRHSIKWAEVKIGASLEPVIPTTAAIFLVLLYLIATLLPEEYRLELAQKGIDLDSTFWLLVAAGILFIPNGFMTVVNRRVEGADRLKAGSFLFLTLFILFIGLIKLTAC